MTNLKSPLRCYGGKARLVESLVPYLTPEPGCRIIDPFCGSGIVALAQASPAIIADADPDVANFHIAVRDNLAGLIDHAEPLFRPSTNNPKAYAGIRSDFHCLPAGVERSAHFLYLAHHAPHRAVANPEACLVNLRSWSDRLQGVEIYSADFELTIGLAQPGDIVYFDPPAVPSAPEYGFAPAAPCGFSGRDQVRVEMAAERLCAAGVTVVVSNSLAAADAGLYAAATELHRELSARDLVAVYAPDPNHPGEIR